MLVVSRLSIAFVLCCALILSGVGTASATDPFSTPPTPLPPGEPGDIIRAEPIVPRALAWRLPASGAAWRILYRSTNATGQPIAVTGTVILPRPGAPRALVGLAPGTQGMADQCAPSRLLRQGLLYESAAITGMLERGWAVAMTDYEGLGTPGTHTYMVGRSSGNSALDVLRAAKRLTAADLPAALPTALTGYSQGGQAAAWAAQLQPTYAPELELVGVAAGGVPSDLAAVQRQVDGGPYAAVMVMGALGLEIAYGVDIDQYHTPRGSREYWESARDCLLTSIFKMGFRRTKPLTTSDPLADPLILARITENKLGGIAPQVPVLLQHGRHDDIIPLAQARAVHQAWCAAGVASRFRTTGLDHIGGFLGNLPRTFDWLRLRFEGKDEAGDCT
ncbi:MAG: lipase family protein [Baekduiaceae bacterium]